MAAIFPPIDQGGIPPGPHTPNGYTPAHIVVGEGPLYVSDECSTVLTAEQLNAITSEILAAVDKLGFSYNSSIVTNLGDALVAKFVEAGDLYVNVSGDTMTGSLILAHDPTQPLEAATKQYAVARSGDVMTGILTLSGDPVQPLDAAPKQYVDTTVENLHQLTEAELVVMQGDINNRVLRPGDQMTGPLLLYHAIDTNDLDAAMRKEYIDKMDALHVLRTGDTMTGPLTLWRDPIGPLEAVTRQYVDQFVGGIEGGFVQRAGDQMLGPLILFRDPQIALEAATKQYVDGQAVNYASKAYVDSQDAKLVAKAGSTMTGPLYLYADPSSPTMAATKQYVDAGDTAARQYADWTAQNQLNNALPNRVYRGGDSMWGDLTINKDTSTLSLQSTGASGGRILSYRYNSWLTWNITQDDIINFHNYNDGTTQYLGSSLAINRNYSWLWQVDTPGTIRAQSGAGSSSPYSGCASFYGGIGVAGQSWFQTRSWFYDGFNIGPTDGPYGIYRDGNSGYLIFNAYQGTYSGYQFFTPNAGRAVCIFNNGQVQIPSLRNGMVSADANGTLYVGSGGGGASFTGYRLRQGLSGAFGDWYFNFYNEGAMVFYLNDSNFGSFLNGGGMDYRAMREVEPLMPMWDIVKKLRPVRYKQTDFDEFRAIDDDDHWGFVAHEVQATTIMQAAGGYKDAPKRVQNVEPMAIIAALTKALQEAMARIEALEEMRYA